jgi:predicted DNA-binding protein (UPF0251 family)
MKILLPLTPEELEALKRAINYALNYPYVSPADERQLGSARAKIAEAIFTSKNLQSNK